MIPLILILLTARIPFEFYSGQPTLQFTSVNNFDDYDVIRYDLRIHLNFEQTEIAGKNTIHFEATKQISELSLNFAGLTIDSIYAREESISYAHQEDLLTVQFTALIPAGQQDSITVYYHGQPKRGLYFRTNSFGDTVVYSHNEPYDARYWFPAKDIPEDKAKAVVTVIYPQKYTSVSNGSLILSKEYAPGMKIDIWREEFPIATYLMSLVCGPFLVAEENFIWQNQSMPLKYFVYLQDIQRGQVSLKGTLALLEFYSSTIGIYPFFDEKYAMVEAPLREASAMENQTCTTMSDRVLDNPEIIAHELAHHWWGNALTPESFSDIWLNEGFATYFDALYTEFAEGTLRFKERMDNFSGLLSQDESLIYPLSDPSPDQLFAATVYFKGAWVLYMLRLELGDNTFAEIIRTYYEAFLYKNVNTASFITVCEQVSGKNLDIFFNQWLFQGGIPELRLTWEQNQGSLKLIIEQVQDPGLYHLDIDVLIRGINRDSVISITSFARINTHSVVFDDIVSSVELDPYNKFLNMNNSPVYYIPEKPAISRIYPNPSNSLFTIAYQLERAQRIELSIWNILGEKVTVLLNSNVGSGLNRLKWDASRQASGVYFCVLQTTDGLDVQKLVLMK
jgi:aminopeptidase N